MKCGDCSARVDMVKATAKGKGQGAGLNIPAKVYEAIGRPTLLALYVDKRGRLLLEPARSLEDVRDLGGVYAKRWMTTVKNYARVAEPVLPTQLKDFLVSLESERARVVVVDASWIEAEFEPRGRESLVLVETAQGARAFRLPASMEEVLRDAIEALGVYEQEPRLTGLRDAAALVLDVNRRSARLYVIKP